MKSFLIIIYSILILTFSLDVNARKGFPYVSGNTLLKACERTQGTQNEDPWADGFCEGFIIGVYDTIEELIDTNLLPSGTHNVSGYYCLQRQLPNDQIIRVVKKYLEDNPADLHYRATILIDLALREAFGPNPC